MKALYEELPHVGTAGETRPGQRSMEDLGWKPMSYGGTTGLSQVSQVYSSSITLPNTDLV